jgi:hypothetical protein
MLCPNSVVCSYNFTNCMGEFIKQPSSLRWLADQTRPYSMLGSVRLLFLNGCPG